MEVIAVIIAGILGWQHGRLGPRELQVMAIVVIGWSAVDAAAMVPYLRLRVLLLDLISNAAVVVVPYLLGMLARRLVPRR